jgi:hypothetical protein
MNREIDLSVSTYGVARQYKYDVAILPWGATEPHNLHLPYMTDCILSHAVAVDAAERALKEYGVRCMVLPPVMMGSQNPGQRDLPFCIHYHYETQFAILKDIVASLAHQGLRRLLIINGHGGNSFKQMIRDMEAPLSSPEGDTNASKTIEAPSGAVGGAIGEAVGLCCEWYDYRGPRCADIDQAPLLATLTAPEVCIPDSCHDNIGLILSGFIEVPADGIYTFALLSDDGSYLMLDGKMVVDNDGEHSPREQIGQHAMQKGLHPLLVRYFDHNGGKLQLRVMDQKGQPVSVSYWH